MSSIARRKLKVKLLKLLGLWEYDPKVRKQKYNRKYYRKHKLKHREQMRLWWIENGDRLKNDPEWCERHRANSRRSRAAHPEYSQTCNQARRARVCGSDGRHTKDDVILQYSKQDGKCLYCGCVVGGEYHVDHYIPLCCGGSNGPENIVVACPRCNFSKGGLLPEYWFQTSGYRRCPS
jgi:hypothetical protein